MNTSSCYVLLTVCAALQLMELLTTGLTELAKAKPAGIEAVQWLGEWLLANNPNQPSVIEPAE